ncbi:MAG TPA: hypothetical protein VE130_08505 [Nitrososphaeraceae archaeon]|nr:hypothetical protein [Nitrososphaeraceae archaeon]
MVVRGVVLWIRIRVPVVTTIQKLLRGLVVMAIGFVLNAYGIKGTLGLKQGANLVLSGFMLLSLFCGIPYMYGDEFTSSLFGNDTFSFYRSYTQLVGGLSFVYLIMLLFYPEQKLATISSIAGWGSILDQRL